MDVDVEDDGDGDEDDTEVELHAENFKDDLKDSTLLLQLLERIGTSPEDRATARDARALFDADSRAEFVLELAERLDPALSEVLSADDVVNCTAPDLLAALLARLMVRRPCLPHLSDWDNILADVAHMRTHLAAAQQQQAERRRALVAHCRRLYRQQLRLRGERTPMEALLQELHAQRGAIEAQEAERGARLAAMQRNEQERKTVREFLKRRHGAAAMHVDTEEQAALKMQAMTAAQREVYLLRQKKLLRRWLLVRRDANKKEHAEEWRVERMRQRARKAAAGAGAGEGEGEGQAGLEEDDDDLGLGRPVFASGASASPDRKGKDEVDRMLEELELSGSDDDDVATDEDEAGELEDRRHRKAFPFKKHKAPQVDPRLVRPLETDLVHYFDRFALAYSEMV